MKNEITIFLILLSLVCGGFVALASSPGERLVANESLGQDPPLLGLDPCTLDDVVCEDEKDDFREVKATVTAYNTVTWQTDSTPCIAANNTNICGRRDAVACPRDIPFGTKVEILGIKYKCLDRLALKYNDRFDISFDKDIEGAKQFGKRVLTVKVYD